MEDIGGARLKSFIPREGFTIPTFIEIACRIGMDMFTFPVILPLPPSPYLPRLKCFQLLPVLLQLFCASSNRSCSARAACGAFSGSDAPRHQPNEHCGEHGDEGFEHHRLWSGFTDALK